MKSKIVWMASFLIVSQIFLVSWPEAKDKTAKDLPPPYKNWLENDVAYIITPKEKDVFLQLETDRERDVFIEAFWKHRDPTPGTPENEFRQEHYRRIAYANDYFGRETTRAGWQTDRGRIYILLGPPLDISKYESISYVYPTQVWFYEGQPQYGIPAHFNIVFFKRYGIGEFVLYSPSQDGPARLIANYKGDPSNIVEAYRALREFDPRLAEVSLSLIPLESPSYEHPSLASEILMNQIDSLPEKTVDWTYADALLKFKDSVDVEYSANYIRSDSLFEVIRDKSGISFLHYSIEPKTLSVLAFEDKYNVNLSLNGIVTDSEGKLIFQFEKNLPLNFNKAQVEDVQKSAIALQDMIPLIPGNYQFDLLLKNTVSKEFTSCGGPISIPADEAAFQMTPLLLGYKIKKDISQRDMNKPFKVGEYEISCQAGAIFHPKENLVVFFQVYGLPEEIHDRGYVQFTFYRKDEEFLSSKEDLKGFVLNMIKEFPLAKFPPDYYKIKVSLRDGNDRETVSRTKEFQISPLTDLPRPWVISKVMPQSHNVEYAFILGSQYANKGNAKEAGKLLEQAYRENPDSLRFSLGYAHFLFTQKEFQKITNILEPFLKKPETRNRYLILLGSSYQALGEYEKAVAVYVNMLSHEGGNLNVLNSLGECYFRLGKLKEALAAWEKSLDINPSQESIKRLVEKLKRK
jgi:GWxTD domain-containing protein